MKQCRRQTGEIASRTETVLKKQAFGGQEDRLQVLFDAKPDQTLAELRDALPSSVVGVAASWIAWV